MFSKWLQAAKIYSDHRMVSMLGLGFSSGFPLVLVSSTLNLWLKESHLPLAIIGFFALVKTPYSFKWAWSPLIDGIKLPLFNRMGRRRGWALFLQICLLLAILAMAQVNPAEHPWVMAGFAGLVVFFSASQDIVLDAYRIDSFETEEQGAGSATFVLGYRIGMIFSGAFALWLAEYVDWHTVYTVMSLGAVVGMATILASKEPLKDQRYREKTEKLPFLPRVRQFMEKSVFAPFVDFMTRKKWWIILIFIFIYRLSDDYKGQMAYPFFDDMGFTKLQIASASKIYGMIATILGGWRGGQIVNRIGLPKTLMLAGVLQGVTNMVYVGQAFAGNNFYMLVVTICCDNIAGGMASIALVAYMSSLCNVAYSATQYALLSSLMSLTRDVVSATSGIFAERVDWPVFFFFSSLLVIPVLILLNYMMRKKIIS